MIKLSEKQKIINETLEKDYLIKYAKGTSSNTNKFHFHDLYEIYFSLSDNIKCFINDKVYDVSYGDVFLFSPTDFHKIVASGNAEYERYFILFNPIYIQYLSTQETDLLKCFSGRESDSTPVIHLDNADSKRFTKLLDKALYFSNLKNFGDDIYKKITLGEILIMTSKNYDNKNFTPCSTSVSSYNKISSIITYIDSHLENKLTLDLLSSNFFISKYYMETLFKSTTGLTVNEYIITKRILRAKELLKKNLTVTLVSEMTGFNNYSHFIRTFTKMVHISPKQYSKKAIYANF